MIKIITILICLIPSLCFADEWTKADTAMEILYAGLHVADWNQTLQIADGETYKESNKILGEYPSKDQVDLYFLTSLLGHYYIAKKLNQPYRLAWQSVWINVQYNAVKHNHKIGLKVKF
jgi:hypothetical protein